MIGNPVNFKSAAGGNWIINDRTTSTLQVAPFYYISVENVEGLYSSDISYESHPVPQENEEFSGDVFRQGRTIVLSGKIRGLNVAKVFEGASYLRRMFNETAIRKLTFTPWDYRIGTVYVNCRVNQDLSIVESFEEGKYVWPWVVGLRSNDSLFYLTSGDTVWDGT